MSSQIDHYLAYLTDGKKQEKVFVTGRFNLRSDAAPACRLESHDLAAV